MHADKCEPVCARSFFSARIVCVQTSTSTAYRTCPILALPESTTVAASSTIETSLGPAQLVEGPYVTVEIIDIQHQGGRLEVLVQARTFVDHEEGRSGRLFTLAKGDTLSIMPERFYAVPDEV